MKGEFKSVLISINQLNQNRFLGKKLLGPEVQENKNSKLCSKARTQKHERHAKIQKETVTVWQRKADNKIVEISMSKHKILKREVVCTVQHVASV